MKKNYTKPAIGMQSIEPCAIMAGSGPTPQKYTTVTVGNLGIDLDALVFIVSAPTCIEKQLLKAVL